MDRAAAGLGKIRRLDADVVNRIAAGEVLQRPASALKEMLENSLDAGATQIIVTVKDGGKALLQIQDNGHGIHKEDLPILCERHTTSKLREFEDLEDIQTLGFRGEALASISYVAHLSVTTMMAGQMHGWRVTYRDGVMDEGGPKPAAANPGTLISVEDLFYNVPLRKKALKGAPEEYNHILDVMGRYAVYKAGVSMICKRHGESRSDLHTLAGASRLDNIRAVFGVAVSRQVEPFELVKGGGAAGAAKPVLEEFDGDLHFEVQGYLSSADYGGKKTQMVLFINGRSVECTALKRALEATYAALLPKAAKPFIFLDVQLPGSHVDVNMHPTKREVGFLHQDGLIDAIQMAVEEKLLSANARRTYAQTLLPGAPLPDASAEKYVQQAAYYRPDRLVRTDAKAQTLHAFLGSGTRIEQQQQQQQATVTLSAAAAHIAQEQEHAGSAAPPASAGHAETIGTGPLHHQDGVAAAALAGPTGRRHTAAWQQAGAGDGAFDFMPTAMEISGAMLANPPPKNSQQQQQQVQFAAPVRQQRIAGTSSKLASVQALLSAVEAQPHAGMHGVLQSFTYVGMASGTLALIQHGTRLYLLDVERLSADMFYQQALRQFGGFRRILLQPPMPLESLVLTALDAQEVLGKWRDSHEGGTKQEVAALLLHLLQHKAGMLDELLGIKITADGCLSSLPQLIEHYMPDLDRLPAFVLALAHDVEWTQEEACFHGLSLALAELYRVQPSLSNAAVGSRGSMESVEQEQEAQRRHEWTVQHVVLPALRLCLTPSRQRARDGSMVELTRLETLYRVFERC